MSNKVIFYKDLANEWRWKVKAANGNVIGDSSEGYKNFKDCEAEFITLRTGDIKMHIDKSLK